MDACKDSLLKDFIEEAVVRRHEPVRASLRNEDGPVGGGTGIHDRQMNRPRKKMRGRADKQRSRPASGPSEIIGSEEIVKANKNNEK